MIAERRVRPLIDEEVSVREALVRALEDAGIDMIFGMPGGYTVPLFDALHGHKDRVRAVLVREESLAGIMAEAYGRLTGKPGVAIGQAAFLLSAATGALEAHLSSSPMLLLTDFSTDPHFTHHGPYQSGSGLYGSWDARQAFASFTKSAFVASGGAQTVQCLQLAIKQATTGKRGPVAVLFPLDSLRGRVPPDSLPALYSTQNYLSDACAEADPQSLARAAELLKGAQSPVIIAGNGVRIAGAYDELCSLGEALGAPVATTAGGKSTIAETHELAVGVFGNFGTPVANSVVSDADVVLVVGSKLAPSDTANENPELLDAARQRIIHIDIEALNTSWTYPAEVDLIGDAKRILAQLTEALGQSGAASDRKARLAELKGKLGHFDVPEMHSDAAPLLPQRIVHGIQEAIADDAMVCCDAGENRIFMTHMFQTKSAGSFLQPAGVGAMGYAIPAAMAAKLVYPNRQAVAVCGDGGFGVALNGLMTALEEKINIVVVVFNNSSLGWVQHGQGERVIASELGTFDLAGIAQAMGCVGYRVENPADLEWALKQALSADKPAVVDVQASMSETYLKVTSPLMNRPRK